MTAGSDCRSTQALLQRYVTGAPLGRGELERAIGHASAATVDPVELHERALVTGLADADRLTRRRAAERLGRRSVLGAAARLALADVAAADPERSVRNEAATALARLGHRL
jgi:hypothetical protein